MLSMNSLLWQIIGKLPIMDLKQEDTVKKTQRPNCWNSASLYSIWMKISCWSPRPLDRLFLGDLATIF